MFLCHLVPWPSVDSHGKILRRSSQGNPPSGGLNARWVAKCSDCSIGGKLVLITNSHTYMSFRLVLKSETLNDLERRILCYFTEFSSFWGLLRKGGWRCHCEKSSRLLSHLLMSFLFLYLLGRIAVYCYRPTSMVSWSVCWSIEMPFGLRTLVGPGNHVVDGVQIPHGKGQFWEGKGASHCKV